MKHFAPDPWCGGRSADRLPHMHVHRMKQAGAIPSHP
jgi:hypothetical protein